VRFDVLKRKGDWEEEGVPTLRRLGTEPSLSEATVFIKPNEGEKKGEPGKEGCDCRSEKIVHAWEGNAGGRPVRTLIAGLPDKVSRRTWDGCRG